MEFINDFPDYLIDENGNIYSIKKKKFLNPSITDKGYLKVNLYNNGVYKTKFVHRLVAETFLPNPDNLPQINHKNECKTDNSVNNLEWCSASYNINYGSRNKKISRKVQCIETGIVYDSLREAGRKTGINYQNISNNIKGKTKSCFGLHWKEILE